MAKNLLKIPKHVMRKLDKIGERYLVAGVVVMRSAAELKDGSLAHLGVALTDAGLELPSEIEPPAESGKYSRRNREGYEVRRTDLPKETFSVTHEAPNWGGYGTHTVYQTRERFPIEYHAPRHSTIELDCEDSSAGKPQYSIKCEVSQVLDRQAQGFEEALLACLNLLQENVGDCDIGRAGATFADYIQSIKVKWEVLPPGTKEEAFARVFGGRTPSSEERVLVEDRFNFFGSLRPKAHIYGRSGLQRYFGAQIKDDLVVFENMEHGNAMYVMFEDWEDLSQKSRVDLLSGRYGDGFERVVHAGDWKERVREILQKRKN